MIDRFINLIGRNAKFPAIALVALIIANVGFQFFAHKTTALTPWKGGGFGMYTQNHVDNRTVWLEFTGANGIAHMRVYPENEGIRTWVDGVSLRGGAVLQKITNQAADLRFYPQAQDAAGLIGNVARIGWLEELTGGITPKEGKTFKPADIRVLVYENQQDMALGTLTRHVVFEGGV